MKYFLARKKIFFQFFSTRFFFYNFPFMISLLVGLLPRCVNSILFFVQKDSIVVDHNESVGA